MKESAARTLEMVESSLRSRARRYQAERSPCRGRYPEEFKREIVAVLRSGVPLEILSGKLDLPKVTIRNWQNSIALTAEERPACRPLRVVAGEEPERVVQECDPVEPEPILCVIKLPHGVEIALPTAGVDERILRLVMGVMS